MNDLALEEEYEDAVAIIGMAGRVPGASTLAQFWENLCAGRAATTFFSEEALRKAGHPPALLHNPAFVKAGVVLDQIEDFDAAFFGITQRQAERMDPQHRLFLECAWEALEHAGIVPEGYPGLIGVYAGTSQSTYQWLHLFPLFDPAGGLENLQLILDNDKDHLATYVSYKLNLTGPSLSIQTASSTSLVAVHVACQGLLNGECDVALAGGVTIRLPQAGYLYQEGGIVSPDGYCRSFDAQGKGTIFGNGLGIVVLKRLADALQAGDCVLALIRGSAINNDGAQKVGYTAPSQQGQARVIRDALAVAGVPLATISYIEAHGTATPLGDLIEMAALNQVFATSTTPCALGSVKSNLGHLEAAAGVIGLIKTVLALQHHLIPPSLHFQTPNPQINFARSPFYVNTALTEWQNNGPQGAPRRAGVSSFGMGGTNAHVIVEEAPPRQLDATLPDEAGNVYLLPLSARSPQALQALAIAYQAFLADPQAGAQSTLHDICTSASLRRAHHDQRLAVVGASHAELIRQLQSWAESQAAPSKGQGSVQRKIVFVFSGNGAQWWGMGRQLLDQEPCFRQTIKACDAALQRVGGGGWSLWDEFTADEASSRLAQTDILQPCLFALQVGLVSLWRAWGIEPDAVVGHSLGEVAAAHVAGAVSLDEAMRIVWWRSQLLKQQGQPGAMAFVELTGEQAEQALAQMAPGVTIAAQNGPQATIVAGERDAIEALLEKLGQQGVVCRWVNVEYAFHSAQMDPVRPALEQALQGIQPQANGIPFYSTVTGGSMDGRLCDAAYWGRNLREPVRFAAATQQLLEQGHTVFIEISPHPLLLSAIAQTAAKGRPAQPIVTLPSLRKQMAERTVLLGSLGRLYELGYTVAWPKLYPERGQFVPLPIYPWQRQRYWIDVVPMGEPTLATANGAKPATVLPVQEHSELRPEQPWHTPPLTQTQAIAHYLQQQVGAALGVATSQLDVQQPLLQLGLDSLMLIGLRNRIQEDWGVRIGIEPLIQGASIAELTSLLSTQLGASEHAPASQPSDALLIPIQPEGSKPPFFCVHPVAGLVFPYYELGAFVGKDQPFYGLQAVGFGVGEQPLHTLPEMAARYLLAIQTVQPQGPYRLGGWSFGAVVAFEMACQLQAAGEKVALLVSFDQAAPATTSLANRWVSTQFFFTTMLRFIWPYIFDFARLRAAGPNQPNASKGDGEHVRPGDLRQLALRTLFAVMRANQQALARYRPQVYPGQMTLLQTRTQLRQYPQDRTGGWGQFVQGGVARYEIPGHHLNLLRFPQVQVVAETLTRCLAQADAAGIEEGENRERK